MNNLILDEYERSMKNTEKSTNFMFVLDYIIQVTTSNVWLTPLWSELIDIGFYAPQKMGKTFPKGDIESLIPSLLVQ